MKYFLFFFLPLVIISHTNAQELARKGSLGVRFKNQDTDEITIQEVFSNTTASKLGILKGDIITAINQRSISSQNDLLKKISLWRTGDSIEISVKRNQSLITLNGIVMPKPKEKPNTGTIEYGAVKYKDGYLRSILNRPEGIEKPPCIYFILGYSCGSIDYYYRKNVIRMLIEGLVEKGFAVYRVERPGMGDSNNSEQCNEIGFHDEIEAFTNGLKTLKNQQKIDTTNIFLFGLSQGSVVATTIATNNPVRGIINYGGLFFTSYYERLLQAPEIRAIHTGISKAEIAADYKVRQPILYELFFNGKHPKELAKNKEWAEVMKTGWPYWDGKFTLGRDPNYLRETNDINLKEALQKAKCPTLAIHGEYDYNIGNSQWAKNTAKTVNSVMPDKGKYIILKGTEHGLTKVSSMKEYIRLLENRAYNDEYREANFNCEIIEVMAKWMTENTI